MDFIIPEIRLNHPRIPSSLHETYRNYMTLRSESVYIKYSLIEPHILKIIILICSELLEKALIKTLT